jgi:5-methylcytosine-specific restriction endonuclease McrA
MRRKRKAGKITIRRADGSANVVKPGHFAKRRPEKPRTRYQRYLRSPQWKAKRRAVLERDRHLCVHCGNGWRLEVHHLTYERLYDELLTDLATLCRDCHIAHHRQAHAA